MVQFLLGFITGVMFIIVVSVNAICYAYTVSRNGNATLYIYLICHETNMSVTDCETSPRYHHRHQDRHSLSLPCSRNKYYAKRWKHVF